MVLTSLYYIALASMREMAIELIAGFAALSHHLDYLEGLTTDGWPIGGLALTGMAKNRDPL